MNLAIAIDTLSNLKKDQVQLITLLKQNLNVQDDRLPMALPEDLVKLYDENQKEIARLSHNIYVTNHRTFDEDGTSLTLLLCRERAVINMINELSVNLDEYYLGGIISRGHEFLGLRKKINELNWKTELIEDV